MNRPLYESNAHRKLQNMAARWIEHLYSVSIHTYPTTSRADWLISQKGIHYCLAEFKGRKFKIDAPFNVNEGVMIGKDKIDGLIAMAKELRVPCSWFVWCFSGLFVCPVPAPGSTIKTNAGRTRQTRDALDIEDCVMIPIGAFKLLDEEPLPEGVI